MSDNPIVQFPSKHPDKMKSGDPGAFVSDDGDILNVGIAAPVPDMPSPEFGQLDLDALFNMREWVRAALEAKGAKVIGAGIGCGGTMGIADIQIELEGCECNIEVRPLRRSLPPPQETKP